MVRRGRVGNGGKAVGVRHKQKHKKATMFWGGWEKGGQGQAAGMGQVGKVVGGRHGGGGWEGTMVGVAGGQEGGGGTGRKVVGQVGRQEVEGRQVVG